MLYVAAGDCVSRQEQGLRLALALLPIRPIEISEAVVGVAREYFVNGTAPNSEPLRER